jgi:hypothetical protein
MNWIRFESNYQKIHDDLSKNTSSAMKNFVSKKYLEDENVSFARQETYDTHKHHDL